MKYLSRFCGATMVLAIGPLVWAAVMWGDFYSSPEPYKPYIAADVAVLLVSFIGWVVGYPE